MGIATFAGDINVATKITVLRANKQHKCAKAWQQTYWCVMPALSFLYLSLK